MTKPSLISRVTAKRLNAVAGREQAIVGLAAVGEVFEVDFNCADHAVGVGVDACHFGCVGVEDALIDPVDRRFEGRRPWAAGLMLALSLEMIRISIAQAAAWANAGMPMRLSLNVDPPELLSGAWCPR